MSILRFLVVTFSVLVVVDLADVNKRILDVFCGIGALVCPVGVKLPHQYNRTTFKACLEPNVVGPCRAFIPRYFYNTVTSSCERFIYGGCLRNYNNFETEEECKMRCNGKILG